MHDDEPEPTAGTLRVGGWLPPVSPASPAPQDIPAESARPVPEPKAAGERPTVSRLTRSARRRAMALARRRGAVEGAAVFTALAVAGVLIGVISRPDSPAAVAGLPVVPQPAAAADPPVTLPSGFPSTSPAPQSPATASPSHNGAVRPSAAKRSPAPSRAPSARPAPFQASYEAESERNVMGGQARPMPRDDASDGLVVRFVGDGEDNFLRFTGLTVPDSDAYSVRIHYISGDPRQATILVNGRLLETLTFPVSPDWYTVDSVTLRIALKAGANTIELRNDTEDAPDFDRIDLTR
ncbi:hypothetical protein [Actinoplanes sp. NPDC026623]|uniref:hypothetical protein n=1 Tax=Actinoplanes sp. NPDC026623 TaxID=3155610 RepID=UPI0033D4A3EF